MIEVTCLTETVDASRVLSLPRHMTRSFPIRAVRGIEIPGSLSTIVPDTRDKKIIREVITLTRKKAERLGEFVSRIVVGGEKIYYNCVSFTAYMTGGIALDGARPGMTAVVAKNSLHEVDPERLVSGDSHLVYLADQKTAVHSIVGTDCPSEHLAVWGDNSLLAFGSNRDMLETFDAAHILKVDGMLSLQPTP